jgi:tRNA (guanine37-N1)-methyltransferase
MNFHVLTLFPQMIMDGCKTSILGRAMDKGLISVEAIDIRDYSTNKHMKVDDYPYGGGAGMVMQAPPVYDAYKSLNLDKKVHVIYMSPQGRRFNQEIAKELAQYEEIVLLCGHYEGIDERVKTLVTDEISIGDFVLTGGEIPAAAIVDSVVRLLPGALGGGSEATSKESFGAEGLLEAPQYTRPPEYRGLKVPEVLIKGDHAKTESWRKRQAFDLTSRNRPDIIAMGGTYAV